jgi:hypothetical protein
VTLTLTLTSQSEPSELLLRRDSSSGARAKTASLLAATPTATPRAVAYIYREVHRPTAGSQSPGCRTKRTAVASTIQPAAAGVSPVFITRPALELRPFSGPHNNSPVTALCLPARLYVLLLTTINTCYRLSLRVPEPTSTNVLLLLLYYRFNQG